MLHSKYILKYCDIIAFLIHLPILSYIKATNAYFR